jgi:hypothetical protein
MSQRDRRSRLPDADGVTHWLISSAARRAPDYLSSRLEEEWLADLESRISALARLRFAMGCCWAVAVIGQDYRRGRIACSSAASVPCGINSSDRNLNYFSLGSPTLFLIVGLHAALFCGLVTVTTLAHRGADTEPSVALIALPRSN